MNSLTGTIVNAVAVIIGSALGLMIPKMSERIRAVIMQGLGLAILFVGISMGLKTQNFLLIIISLTLGGAIGAALKLEECLQNVGEKVERGFQKLSRKETSIAEGFVSATLLFCVGAMAVVGALDGGLRGDHTVLYTKSMLDGISAMLLTTTLGAGVMFSAIALFVYQGAIALSANYITSFIAEDKLGAIVTEVSATGGILIAAIGIGVLQIKKISAINLLPSIFIAAVIAYFIS